jgi:hypothetical protein
VSAFVINSYAFGGEDPDAKAYLDAVETADTQALEAAVRKAVDDFVKGCKADGIWSAIKASCILAGARTLTGALTPLVGSAPTNWNGNFVSGDYSRKDGLLGNGSNKALISNYAHNAAGQNDRHMAVYVSQLYSGLPSMRFVDDGNGALAGGSHLRNASSTFTVRIAATSIANVARTPVIGLLGASRNNSSNYTRRAGGSTGSVNDTSQTPTSTTYIIFDRGQNSLPATGAQAEFVDGALSFYSLGEALDLANLDTRVTTLMSDLDAAI